MNKETVTALQARLYEIGSRLEGQQKQMVKIIEEFNAIKAKRDSVQEAIELLRLEHKAITEDLQIEKAITG